MSIVLIGMPGCGKTTIGASLSKELEKEFIDMDKLIEEREQRTITDIFSQNGEQYFRKAEAQLLKEIIDKDAVISTGGGIVVKDENVVLLKKSNAKVIFIDREPEDILSTMNASNRPLLKDNTEKIYKLYEQRYNKYLDACDIHIKNDDEKYKVIAHIKNRVIK